MTRSPGEVPERAYGIPMTTISDKMAARGVGALTDRELLTLLTEDGQRADALLAACGDSLARIAGEGEARLRMIGGLGLRRARLLLAAAEFGRRAVAERAAEADCIATSDDVVRLFRPQLEQLPHEECWAVYLTASNRIIERQRVSQGGVTGTVVDHRIVVKRALELLATQLILIHNHPSGTAESRPQDRALTERIARAAALFDIRLLDHIVIARGGDFSFLRAGRLGWPVRLRGRVPRERNSPPAGGNIHLFCTFVVRKISKIPKYDDAGRTFQEAGRPLQGVRVRVSFERDLRRSGRRL